MSSPYREPGSPTDCITQLVVDVLSNEIGKTIEVKARPQHRTPIWNDKEPLQELLNAILPQRYRVTGVFLPIWFDGITFVVQGPGGEQRQVELSGPARFKHGIHESQILRAYYEAILDDFE